MVKTKTIVGVIIISIATILICCNNYLQIVKQIYWTYTEILFEIYNYPEEFKVVCYRMGYHKYHFYWCKDKLYLNKWRLINDFLSNPEKYTFEYKMSKVVDVDNKKNLTKNNPTQIQLEL